MKIFVLLMAMAGGLFAAEDKAQQDPIVGKWRWFDGRVIEFRTDNRMETVQAPKKVKIGKGTWEFQAGPSVERKYKLKWGEGVFLNELTMSKDGKSIKGTNPEGVKITGDKLE